MVKSSSSRIFTATYSNIPVYEFQFGDGSKEHVMRRRGDNWINATHILKAAGFDKPTRTRILEREVQIGKHEKIQGGYGKYQGTWVPLEKGQALAQRNHVYEKLRAIFEYKPGLESPPMAPKHTNAKSKVLKGNTVTKSQRLSNKNSNIENENTPNRQQITADDATVDSYLNMNMKYDTLSSTSTHRKRKRPTQITHKQSHVLYSDELLDYFMLSRYTVGRIKPEPPPSFDPDWIVDNEGNTALHWAAAMGDIEIIRDLKQYGATLGFQNVRGETPLMRCVIFENCMDKKTMPEVVNEFIETVNLIDFCHANVLHHAAAMTISHPKHSYARYYLDILLNKIQEFFEPHFAAQIINAQDVEGNTALHIAAKHGARNCVRALIGRSALTDIKNNEGITAEDLIRDLIENRRIDHQSRSSSSPFSLANYYNSNREVLENPKKTFKFISQTALSVNATVAPQLIGRMQDLAESFNNELKNTDVLAQETRRKLNSTIAESDEMEKQVKDLQKMKYNPEKKNHSQDELNSIKKKLDSMVEKQQINQLQTTYDCEHEKLKGISNSKEFESERDELLERVKISRSLDEEQKKRQELVRSYCDARSMASEGEKNELYRRFLVKSFGPEISIADQNLNKLVKQLKQDHSLVPV